MKTIKMDYEEYQELLKVINDQKEVIDVLEHSNADVIIEYRDGGMGYYGNGVPIISCRDDLYKEYLKKEFDMLAAGYESVRDGLEKIRKCRLSFDKLVEYAEEMEDSRRRKERRW